MRCIAVIAVTLYHLDPKLISGGFLGVDVFFVISGFLITSLIVREQEAGDFSFRNFWARRVRRILPALLTVIATTLLVAWFIVFRYDLESTIDQARYAMLSLANIYFWQQRTHYWGEAAQESPLLHTWSLSVEEQFYLVLPVTLVLLLKHKPKWVNPLITLAMLGSLGLFLKLAGNKPHATFYWLPTRAWELGIGCYTALACGGQLTSKLPRALSETLQFLGLVIILFAYYFISRDDGLTIAMLAPTLGAAMIVAAPGTGLGHRLLCLPPVVYVGKISYSLYLWHWPIFTYCRYLALHRELEIPLWLQLAATFPIAALSYHFIEKPARSHPRSLPWIGGAFILLLGAILGLKSLPLRYDLDRFEQPAWYGLLYETGPEYPPATINDRLTHGLDCPPRNQPPNCYRTGGVIVGDDKVPRVVVLGDSHGAMWSSTIQSVIEELGVTTSFLCINGVRPSLNNPPRHEAVSFLTADQKYDYDKRRIELLQTWQPDVVILAPLWRLESPESLQDLGDLLQEVAGSVLLVQCPPEIVGLEKRSVAQYLCYRGFQPEPGAKQYLPFGNSERNKYGNWVMEKFANTHDKATIIPTADLFQGPNGESLVLKGDQVLYWDDNHITEQGARLARTRLREAITKALEKPRSVTPQ